METPVKQERIWLCSVVFLDLVKYSLQSLEIQTAWKQRFKQYLAASIAEYPEADRLVVDTGDGAAISFLGDPEAAMYCALKMASGRAREKREQSHPFQMRTGINLGSVRLMKDVNGIIQAVGDGINVGQRVMSFAGINQILVSRSFYEVASSFSATNASLFRYKGVETDKHDREHTLYELRPPDAAMTAMEPKTLTGSPVKRVPLTDAQVALVETRLAEIIGPMANHLVRRAVSSCKTVETFRDALLLTMPSSADQQIFLRNCGSIFRTEAVGPVRTVVAPAAPATPPPRTEFTWDPDVLDRARQHLAAHMGPIARVLVDRAAGQTRTRAALYEMLAAEINAPKEREQFLRHLQAGG